MARPKKTGLDYFPFDVDFFDDEKIVAIAGEFGLKGEISVVKLLCAIYRNGYFIEWSDMLKMKMLRSLPGVSAELLDQIVARLVKWGFFDKSLFDSVRVLTSKGIQRRYLSASRGRKKSEKYDYLLVSYEEIGVSYEETMLKQEFLTKKCNKEKNIKESSNFVEEKKDSVTTNNIHEEVRLMKQEEGWLDQLQCVHHTDKESLVTRLDEFAANCMANGMEGHRSLADAKYHFNSWMRIVTDKENDKDSKNARNQRRGNVLSPDGTKKYGDTF